MKCFHFLVFFSSCLPWLRFTKSAQLTWPSNPNHPMVDVSSSWFKSNLRMQNWIDKLKWWDQSKKNVLAIFEWRSLSPKFFFNLVCVWILLVKLNTPRLWLYCFFKFVYSQIIEHRGVVYFDQQTHDCACVRMVEKQIIFNKL